jgi:hypothetical protein
MLIVVVALVSAEVADVRTTALAAATKILTDVSKGFH